MAGCVQASKQASEKGGEREGVEGEKEEEEEEEVVIRPSRQQRWCWQTWDAD